MSSPKARLQVTMKGRDGQKKFMVLSERSATIRELREIIQVQAAKLYPHLIPTDTFGSIPIIKDKDQYDIYDEYLVGDVFDVVDSLFAYSEAKGAKGNRIDRDGNNNSESSRSSIKRGEDAVKRKRNDTPSSTSSPVLSPSRPSSATISPETPAKKQKVQQQQQQQPPVEPVPLLPTLDQVAESDPSTLSATSDAVVTTGIKKKRKKKASTMDEINSNDKSESPDKPQVQSTVGSKSNKIEGSMETVIQKAAEKKKEATEEKKKVAEEKKKVVEEKKKAVEEKKKAAEEKNRQIAAKEEKRKKAAEEEKKQKAAEEEKKKQKVVEEERIKTAEEAKKKKSAEEKTLKVAEEKAREALREQKETQKDVQQQPQDAGKKASEIPDKASTIRSAARPVRGAAAKASEKVAMINADAEKFLAGDDGDGLIEQETQESILSAGTSDKNPESSTEEKAGVDVEKKEDTVVDLPPSPKRRPGRPPKNKVQGTTAMVGKQTDVVDALVTPVPKKRGRPPKAKPVDSAPALDPAVPAEPVPSTLTVSPPVAPSASKSKSAIPEAHSMAKEITDTAPSVSEASSIVKSPNVTFTSSTIDREMEVFEFLKLKGQSTTTATTATNSTSTLKASESPSGTSHPLAANINSPQQRFTDKPSMDYSDSDSDSDQSRGEPYASPTMPPVIMSSRPSIISANSKQRLGSPLGLGISPAASPSLPSRTISSIPKTAASSAMVPSSMNLGSHGSVDNGVLTEDEDKDADHGDLSDDDSTSSDSGSESSSDSSDDSSSDEDVENGKDIKEKKSANTNRPRLQGSASSILNGMLSLKGANTPSLVHDDSSINGHMPSPSLYGSGRSFASLSDISSMNGLPKITSLTELTAQSRANKQMGSIGSALASPVSSSASSVMHKGMIKGSEQSEDSQSEDFDDDDDDSDVDSSDESGAEAKKGGPQVKIAGRKRKTPSVVSAKGAVIKKKKGNMNAMFK